MRVLCIFLLISFANPLAAQQATLYSLKGYGGNATDGVSSQVTRTYDGGFIVEIGSNSNFHTGNIDSFCEMDGRRTIFLKYNHDASVLEWSKCYSYANGDSAIGYIFPLPNGQQVIAGNFNANAGWGLLIKKEDAQGNLLWQKNYSKGSGAIITNVIATVDGGYIALGESLYTDSNIAVHYGNFMDPDLWILRLDSNGNKVWSKVLGGSGDENGAILVSAPGDGCYVVGGTNSNDHDCTGLHGSTDVYLARMDRYGNLLWHKDIGGSDDDNSFHACANGKGGVLIAGMTLSTDGDVHHNAGNSDYWVIEVDSSSNMLWNASYGGPAYDNAYAICKANDGSIWINGSTGSQGGGEVYASYGQGDAWVVHTDSVGNIINSKVLGGSQEDRGYMVYPLSNGFTMAAGNYTKNDGSLLSLVKYGDFLSTDVFFATLAPWSSSAKEIIDENTGIQIFPNPANGQLFIRKKLAGKEGAKVIIINIAGQTVYTRTIRAGVTETTINTSTFENGEYYVQVICDDGYRETKKILIQ